MTRTRLARPHAALFIVLLVLASAEGFAPLRAQPTPQGTAPAAPPRRGGTGESAGTRMLGAITALTAQGMEGRATGSAGNARARAWIEARLSASGARPLGRAYGQPFTFTTKAGQTMQGTNLVATCPGAAPESPVIVVSAHYDHLGVRNGETYHGADDNASGVAMLLEVARRCVATPFTHTIVLAAFDAEEQGLQGARAFLAAGAVPLARIALDVNFDMVGRSDARELYAAGPGRWPRLLPPLKAAVANAPIAVRFGHDTGGGHNDWTDQSDHGVFHAAGIPYVYFGVEDHADYHKPTDTADKIAPAFLDGVAAVVMASLSALVRAPAFK